jgi:hypothetical protein
LGLFISSNELSATKIHYGEWDPKEMLRYNLSTNKEILVKLAANMISKKENFLAALHGNVKRGTAYLI